MPGKSKEPIAPDNANSLQDLKERLIQHALFIRTKTGKLSKIAGTPLELRGATFTRIIIENFPFNFATITDCDFTYSSFQGSNFEKAILTGSKFVYCNLAGCNFSNAQLPGVAILHSNVKSSNVKSVSAANAFFEFDESGSFSIGFSKQHREQHKTDFSNSDFRGADLTNADLRGANFSAANLENCNLSGADLENANLSDANLTNVNWSNAHLKGVQLDRATFSNDESTRLAFNDRPEFRQFVIKQQKIKWELAAHETWVHSKSSDGTKAVFTGREIRGCDFRYRTLAATEFANTNIRASRFDEAVLVASSFEGSKIAYCNFDGIDARSFRCKGAEFDFCSFVDADFSPLDIIGHETDKMAESDFTQATFRNCDFTGAVLTKRILSQASFINCKRDWSSNDAE